MDKEPSKEAIEKACEMLGFLPDDYLSASWKVPIRRVARFIDHVSEVAKKSIDRLDAFDRVCTLTSIERETLSDLRALILPDPEPDVLAELIDDVVDMRKERRRLWFGQKQVFASDIRKALSARGLEIRKVPQP